LLNVHGGQLIPAITVNSDCQVETASVDHDRVAVPAAGTLGFSGGRQRHFVGARPLPTRDR